MQEKYPVPRLAVAAAMWSSRWSGQWVALAVAIVATATWPAYGGEVAGWESNQCVACHQVEQLPISLGHSMSEWQASSHARSGVGCEKCHGGNASIAAGQAVHEGVLPSSDPKSKVSPHNLAATCGACHEGQYEAYKDTVHAKQVASDSDAATCLTCHGSMATSYPSPRELKARCGVCHDKPVQAQAALSWLAAAKTHLLRARRAVDEARSTAPDWYPGAVARFHSMEKDLAAIELEWHKFDMEECVKQSRDLLSLGKLLEEEARLKVKLKEEMAE
jgi:nitrate/TMAO reductase-like tetraheme cytochrome c subunit